MRDPFIHERALCESDQIGPRSRIWAFTHILPGARIGADCNICDYVFIEDGVVIGDRVTVKSGVQLWTGVELEDDVFIGPNATFTNDPLPRSRRWLSEHPSTVVRAGASVGASATILPGIEIGRGAMVGAGAVVTHPVPPHAIVIGNPARIKGYIQTEGSVARAPSPSNGKAGRTALGVPGVHVQRFAAFADMRGTLTAGELPSEDIPFVPKRWFMVYDVPSREVRGEHAHRACHQFLVCVSGSVGVVVDDGQHRGEILLDDLTLGVYIPPLVWGSQFRYESNSVLLVFASHAYDPDDYIREYDTFLSEVNSDPSLAGSS
ncbi:MAG TPA: WxcM-like domain-containing protein [Solirubrobacteraceae bacterium]|jgi:acetyltransferase-like isoleucine patch superfamily enzyme/dTDP-4-dehydrorhamnose 3,5-epimerase-like enzyme|nr:WxcM-like domain-containing protein [Solirubrobacteraceae bacterium]